MAGEVKYCRKCGRENAADALFCRYCGNPVRDGENFSTVRGGYAPRPKEKKRRADLMPVIAAVLVVALLGTGFGWPGWIRLIIRGDRNEAVIHTAEVNLPESTGARAVVEGHAAVAAEAYLVARAYFDKLEHYDLDHFDPDEYTDLLNRTVTAFEVADALSTALEENAEYLEKLEEAGVSGADKATWRELSAGPCPADPFVITAYAADDSPANKWAQDITKIYDKAPVGKGIRTLAKEMGTDAKHAYAMLTQAQAIISGEELAAADMYNAAYQTAVETKAAASTAGFVVAVAASGGAAAGVASALEVGGVVCGGVQAVLDIGTAVTIATTNGEGNEYTTAFEKTSSQFAPVSALFALGNAGVNAYNIYKGVDVNDNKAQGLIYLANSLTDYITGGTILGGTLTHTGDGLEFTLMDTLFGTEPGQKDAAEKVLRETGVSEKTIEEAMRIVEGSETVSDPESVEDLSQVADQYIEEWDIFTDPEEPFDLDGFNEFTREELASYGEDYVEVEWDRPEIVEPGLHIDTDDEGGSLDAPVFEEETESTPESETASETESVQKPDGGYEEGITGSYAMTADIANGGHWEAVAEVLLHDSGKMEISFDGEHLVGTYDPSTHTFVGIGDVFTGDPMMDTSFNYYETTITFDTTSEPYTATGIHEVNGGFVDVTTRIRMKKTD